MRIAVVTQNAPLYLPQFLDNFLATLSGSEHEITDILIFSSTFEKTIWQELGERFRFYGPVDFVRALAHIAKGKALSALHRFRPQSQCHSIGNVIQKYGLRRFATDSVNSGDFIDRIASAKIDLVISIASPKIFRQPLLDAPTYGCINYHTAMLPKYRGRQPLFWAMLHDEAEVGISIHEMDAKLDNGPILVQERVKVESGETLHSLYLKTIERGPGLMVEAIEKLDGGISDRIENDKAQATSFRFPGPEDSRKFRAQGKRFF